MEDFYFSLFEKIETFGVESLSDEELLELILSIFNLDLIKIKDFYYHKKNLNLNSILILELIRRFSLIKVESF